MFLVLLEVLIFILFSSIISHLLFHFILSLCVNLMFFLVLAFFGALEITVHVKQWLILHFEGVFPWF